MPVIITMQSGERYTCDRNLATREVMNRVNDARQVGKLIEIEDNGTPSGGMFCIDPARVESIRHDGHNY